MTDIWQNNEGWDGRKVIIHSLNDKGDFITLHIIGGPPEHSTPFSVLKGSDSILQAISPPFFFLSTEKSQQPKCQTVGVNK